MPLALITAADARLPRKTMLVGLMVLCVAAHLLSALAPSYGMLMTGRIVASSALGAFIGIGAVVAADQAVIEVRRDRAPV
jgi:DHA1 family inner membrane transport protein